MDEQEETKETETESEANGTLLRSISVMPDVITER